MAARRPPSASRRLLLASFYGDPALSNGPGQFSRSLRRAMESAGWQVDVWSCATADVTSRSEDSPKPTIVPRRSDERPRRWLESWLPDPTVAEFARRELNRLRPDVVLVGAWQHLGTVALAAQELGIPVVLHPHDYSLVCLRTWLLDSTATACSGPETDAKCVRCLSQSLGAKGRAVRSLSALPVIGSRLAKAWGKPSDDSFRLAKAVDLARDHMRSVIDAASLIIAQTDRTRDVMIRSGVPAERVVVVHQCMAPEKARTDSAHKRVDQGLGESPSGKSSPKNSESEPPTGDPETPPRYLYVGRWATPKGARLLVDAFLDADLPVGSELTLAVSNPAAVRLPVTGWHAGKLVRLCAGFFGSATSELMATTDVCVVPSRCEELASRTVLEALEHDVPVIASSTVGNSYLVDDGSNGRVFDSGSQPALVAALEEASQPGTLARWRGALRRGPAFDQWQEQIVEAIERVALEETNSSKPQSGAPKSAPPLQDPANEDKAPRRVPGPEAPTDKQVVIAVPAYRGGLTADEEASLRNLEHHLADFERVAVLPESMESPFPDWRVERFSDTYFRDVPSYSQLLLTPDFYRRFADAEFLLIYQLDCLALSNRLAEWCAAGYDYIGAPWLKDRQRPELGFSRVGNGGLSLRRIEACLSVLGAGPSTRQRDRPQPPSIASLLRAPMPDFDDLPATQRWRRRFRTINEARQGIKTYAGSYRINEDHFWSDRARLFDATFNIAPVDAALDFAFEVAPAYCLEENGGELPFGCHGWWRYDRAFWEPHIVPA